MPSSIELDVTELTEFTKRVQAAGDTVARISINEGLRRIGKLIVPASGSGPLAAATPKVTGKLRRSTVFQILGGPKNQILEIRQAARSEDGLFYGAIVREGRGPVEAKQAKFLHFFIGEQEFFRKRVGPARANPYHRRVLRQLMPRIQKIVNDMGEKVTAHLSGRG